MKFKPGKTLIKYCAFGCVVATISFEIHQESLKPRSEIQAKQNEYTFFACLDGYTESSLNSNCSLKRGIVCIMA